MDRSSESGVALYYIFIGVFLFGALSFAVMQMNRGGGDKIKDDVYYLHAGQIMDFGRALQTAVKMMKIDGITDNRISFENGITTVDYANAACVTASCKIFDPVGGSVMYRAPDLNWLNVGNNTEPTYGEWIFSGANQVTGVGTDGGAGSSELLAILPWVNRAVCLAINKMLAVENPDGSPPQDNGDVDLANFYTGTYSAGEAIGGDDPEIEGRRAGCFEGGGNPGAGTYHFFQVLVAR